MASMTATPGTPTPTGERSDLLEALSKQRWLLRFPLRDLTDEQAGATPTASALCLGGLIKHVATAESGWVDFILHGPAGMSPPDDEAGMDAWMGRFRMAPGETVSAVMAEYDTVARRTDEVVRNLPDLDVSHPLPAAPWFEPGARWSARRVLVHIIAETAQHAGHADIIRETIDGSRSMG